MLNFNRISEIIRLKLTDNANTPYLRRHGNLYRRPPLFFLKNPCWANVLRLKPGHPVVLFNGDGNEYSGEIQDISKKQPIYVDARLGISVESPLQIHLAQGISKGERMDLVMQKAAELGVNEITHRSLLNGALSSSMQKDGTRNSNTGKKSSSQAVSSVAAISCQNSTNHCLLWSLSISLPIKSA